MKDVRVAGRHVRVAGRHVRVAGRDVRVAMERAAFTGLIKSLAAAGRGA
jgi:hypothetical protein